MGHTTVPDDNNALYGYKGEVKEKLRNRNPPVWLKDFADIGSKMENLTKSKLEEHLEEAKQKAQESKERRKERGYDASNTTQRLELPIKKGKLPGDVREKLNITKQDAREYTGFHHINHREYRLIIEVGTQGGIKDVRLGRDFHH